MFLLIRNYNGKIMFPWWQGNRHDHQSKRILEQNAVIPLYCSCVYPYLTYCNHVWGFTHQTNHKQLFILQTNTLQIKCGKRKTDSMENIFSDLKVLKFIDINLYLTGRFMHELFRGDVPGIFDNFFFAIILFIMTIHYKVNISMYLRGKVISPSSACDTGVLLF